MLAGRWDSFVVVCILQLLFLEGAGFLVLGFRRSALLVGSANMQRRE